MDVEPPAPDWAFETRQIHAGQRPDPATGARALPIYQTTAYVFPSPEVASERFALADPGPIYTRLGNPTTDVVEHRIADLEGGVGAILTASGAAAVQLAVLNLAQAGDHVVSSPSLYGGTYNLFAHTLRRFGVETTFVTDPHDAAAWRAAIRPSTKALFGESVPNPRCDVLDIAAVAGVAHAAGVPLIIDNTVPTPYLLRPIEFGADVVVHSASKYLGGHGVALAGAVVDSGWFDYLRFPERFPGFSQPDPSYHGIVFGEAFGAAANPNHRNRSYIVKARAQLLRDLGATISPFNSFLLALGIETLSLRMDRHVANTQAVARWLEARPEVSAVHYPGLASSPWHATARKYLPRGAGAVLAFELAAGSPEQALARGQAFTQALRLHSNVANIGDVRSLVIHPASTTHAQLTPAEQLLSGVTPGFVRLAVGLEAIDDILADLARGFAALDSPAGASRNPGSTASVVAG